MSIKLLKSQATKMQARLNDLLANQRTLEEEAESIVFAIDSALTAMEQSRVGALVSGSDVVEKDHRALEKEVSSQRLKQQANSRLLSDTAAAIERLTTELGAVQDNIKQLTDAGMHKIAVERLPAALEAAVDVVVKAGVLHALTLHDRGAERFDFAGMAAHILKDTRLSHLRSKKLEILDELRIEAQK